MNKAVQVGLVFPRSGQHVMVQIPLAYAERMGLQHLDQKASQITLVHPVRDPQPCHCIQHAR